MELGEHKHHFDRIRFIGKIPIKQCGECKHEEPVKDNWNWAKFSVSIDRAEKIPDAMITLTKKENK